jgi:hypothetical protein
MDRVEAYATLAAQLERWRRLPYDRLVGLLGSPPTVVSVPLGPEIIDVEVRVAWARPGRAAIRIEATALGPSCWRLERLEESIIVPAPDSSDAVEA